LTLSKLIPPLSRLLLLCALILGCFALVACQGTGPSATPSATTTPSATPPWSSAASLVSGDQAYRHVLALAEDIGPRPAGSDADRRAAQYMSQQLSAYGYETEEQQFTFGYYVETATLEVLAPTPLSLNPHPLRLSASGDVTAELVPAGLGRPQDFPPEGLKDRIALIERGDLSFSDKLTNATAAGAAAVVIYNNVEGHFQGDLREESPIPALSLSQAEGRRLQDLLAESPLTVRLSVQSSEETKTSQNIIARSPQDDCQVIVGAHYDTVETAPGANDNASGSATLLEIARVLDLTDQEEGVCFVAFGAEETLLSGSRHFVAALTSQGQPSLQAMVNLDMVGVGSEWQLTGSPSLVEKIDQEATALGLNPVPTEPHLSSDHVSFINAGIPAIFIHRFEDPHYHSELDRAEFVEPQLLEEAAKLALLALAAPASP
jgi:aminopeptidase YwaD